MTLKETRMARRLDAARVGSERSSRLVRRVSSGHTWVAASVPMSATLIEVPLTGVP